MRIGKTPLMSAYVGADITSGILAAKLAEESGVVLFVDIGTNGEMVLAVNGELTATSTAAGPAFEGMNIACGMRANRGAIECVSLAEGRVEVQTIGSADPVGLCGSGLLDGVGELAAHQGVDANGRFQSKDASWPWKDRWECSRTCLSLRKYLCNPFPFNSMSKIPLSVVPNAVCSIVIAKKNSFPPSA